MWIRENDRLFRIDLIEKGVEAGHFATRRYLRLTWVDFAAYEAPADLKAFLVVKRAT